MEIFKTSGAVPVSLTQTLTIPDFYLHYLHSFDSLRLSFEAALVTIVFATKTHHDQGISYKMSI